MNFGEKSRIKSKEKIVEFLQTEHIGRIATIDKNGFLFIAPMNFLYHNDMIYIHGFPRGEKYDNIQLDSKCGFEVNKELTFLPSYFFEPPTDASLTDTLYVIVIKGYAKLVTDNAEKAQVLNKFIAKYQLKGGMKA
jgi:nitroimidazol reductase NimA-like FMN-containing flavoprotein (pyridoxamine 5'-phosphate oxidase superfamily)